jgi:hypothetical protein
MKSKSSLIIAALLGVTGPAGQVLAVTPAVEGTPFQILGHIQKFTLFTAADLATFCPGTGITLGSGLEGAKMTVNGTEIIIPCNTIVTMPATYLTPKDIFDYAPPPYKAAGQSGLALEDTPPPPPAPRLPAIEVALDGNIVTVAGTARHVAGLVHISQQSLNNGAGYINTIDLDGTLHVGASLTPNPAADALVRINDSQGRFGLQTSFLGPGLTPPPDAPGTIMITQDGRFTADTGNPTIHAQTGYPMCVPRGAGDAKCPTVNRPASGGVPRSFFVMGNAPITPAPGSPTIPPCAGCDPTRQAPLMVGDYINYSGTSATGHPADPPKTLYISAHTINAWVGIYTAPGAPVAYINQEVSMIGTGTTTTDVVPNPVGAGTIAQEVAPRTIKVEGFTTDPSRPISVIALSVDSTGTTTPLLVGTVATDPAPFGRFRFIITRAGVARKLTTLPPGPPVFTVTSPVKELRVVVPGVVITPVANGLTAGQFDAPLSEYIFAENTFFGQPLVPFNFHRFCYLAVGSGPLTTAGRTAGPSVGQLTPWPENPGTPPPPTSFGTPPLPPSNPLCP